MDINIGIPSENREKIAEGLTRVLADTYTLYLKTHSYHWNVTGPQFNTLHTMFMDQYNELWLAIDEIAERIRSLGVVAPGSYSAFAQLTSIDEDSDVPTAEGMLRNLLTGHEVVVRTARSVLPLAGEASDEPTADLLTQRMQASEKTAWMIRSMLS